MVSIATKGLSHFSRLGFGPKAKERRNEPVLHHFSSLLMHSQHRFEKTSVQRKLAEESAATISDEESAKGYMYRIPGA
jgi:hypothetical protein